MNNKTSLIQKEIDEIIALHKMGLFKKALKKTNILSEVHPNNALLFNASGVINASLENFKEAVDCFSKAINIESKYNELKCISKRKYGDTGISIYKREFNG